MRTAAREVAGQQLGHGGLGDEAEHDRGDGDAELGARELEGQAAQQPAELPGPSVAVARRPLDAGAVDRDQRELDGDEERGAEDEHDDQRRARGRCRWPLWQPASAQAGSPLP